MNPEDIFAPGVIVEGGDLSPVLTIDEKLPETVFVFPLKTAVAFPNMMMPVLLDTERSREIIAKAESQNNHVLLLTQRDESIDQPGPAELYRVGVLARILKTLKLPDGNSSVMVQGLQRAKVKRFVRKKPYLLARVKETVDVPAKRTKRNEALFRKLQESLRKVSDLSEGLGNDFSTAVLNIETADQLADFTGSYLLKKTSERQQVLETLDIGRRVELALEFVLTELELTELGNEIQAEIRAKAEKAQKEYFLREQLKIIRRELGEETDAREAELERLQLAITEAEMPESAHERAEEELLRMRTTPAESGEYGVIRNYLDWLTSLPWTRSSQDRQNLKAAAKILDEDHYGLEDVKERILEFLAVRQLRPSHGGSIMCLSGPPGVGKTSLGRSIARAMGREFWRFSLGGMRDEAEIKGHRRTYIGAMPGRILQGLKTCGTNNPVIMLDEIDKLGSDYRGDPSSALLEVLDPEQNSAFLDHYMDVPFDLSKVMFLATANVLPDIPEALRDRMEIVELPGYLMDEKVQIAARHLIPKQLDRHGIKKSDLSLNSSVLKRVIDWHTREAGVRNLEKAIVRLCRKTASALVSRRKTPGRVKIEDLDRYLGKPRYADEGKRQVRVPGVVKGLAWTPHGGDVLYIEASKAPGKGALVLTGRLGDVMSESVRLAISYLRACPFDLGFDCSVMSKVDLHVHFPAGAIPKDGPSAGIAIACAIVSLMSGVKFPMDLAMTGEITLVGEVLPIGGVREKVLAARALGLKRVMLPAENQRDVIELKKDLVKGLQIIYVDTFREVYDVVFGGKKGRRRVR